MIQSVCVYVFVSSAAVSDFLSELPLYYLTAFKLGHWAKGRGGEEERPTGTHTRKQQMQWVVCIQLLKLELLSMKFTLVDQLKTCTLSA